MIKIKKVSTELKMLYCRECGKMTKRDDLFSVEYITEGGVSLKTTMCTDCLVELHNSIEDALDTNGAIY